MFLQVFAKIRNYQITYYYNMLILSQIGQFVLYLPFKRSSSMTEKIKIYDNKRSEERFLYRALGERSNLFHSKLTNLPF
ncbi:MAG: hypothetical protein BWY27_01486 [Bacteroidetes bacterium ADurb.Bin234]|nr:MAG: hypothetical protein BWY27_01486 [Bacteroidetes bacterium ADurb.Bin234]